MAIPLVGRRRYRRHLLEIVNEHHRALFHAVMHSAPESIEEQLAFFIIEEAGLGLIEFLELHEELMGRG